MLTGKMALTIITADIIKMSPVTVGYKSEDSNSYKGLYDLSLQNKLTFF